MKKNKKFSIKVRLLSFKFAFEGLAHFFKTEHNAWIHLAAAVVVISAGLYFNLNVLEWLWISLAICLVFICEIINSAIERTVDLASSEVHPLAKQAKDLGAAATIIAAIFAVIVAIFIFAPYLYDLFQL
ncbi:MAG: diacylglycerol kinase [Arenicella sp.]